MKQEKQITNAFDIYDFDRTIYDGDSTLDFFLFSIRSRPTLLRFIPFQILHGLLFLLRLESKTEFKSNLFIFIRYIEIDSLVREFWKSNFKKIKQWYLSHDHERDIIISASPNFLLAAVAERLKIYKLIATEVDKATGKIKGQNCYGEEKLHRLIYELPNIRIMSCYSDSLSDTPILELAKRAYIVKGDKKTLYRRTYKSIDFS